MAPPKDDFPWKQLGILAICRLAEPVAFVSITSYAFVMVQDIKGDKDASFYAGLLVSAFAAAEACTAWIWGDLSDRFGRKPIILVALAGTALSSIIFGFAKSYWVALLARIVGGALNGNVAVMQTMVAEMVTKPEHEPKAYALQPFMWSLGSIAGSALGGFTAQPATYYPGVFSQDGVFGKFPYLLPNVIAVAVIMVAFLLGYLFLEETNPNLRTPKDHEVEQANYETTETTPLVRGRRESTMSKTTIVSQDRGYVSVQAPLPNDPSIDLRRASIASLASATIFKNPVAAPVMTESAIDDVNDVQDGSIATKTFTSAVIAWSVALWLLCYHQMAFSSLLPVYLLDDPSRSEPGLDLRGGLGQALPQVGTILAVNSIISLVVQGVIFPAYVSRLGVWAATVSLVMAAPFVYFIVPFVTLLPDPKTGVYITMTLQSLAATMAYPTVLILLKNACPSPQVLGRINGVAMSGCSGARTIAPPLVGIFYSTFGSAGAWWSTGAIAVIALIQVVFIPRPREAAKVEVEHAAAPVEAS